MWLHAIKSSHGHPALGPVADVHAILIGRCLDDQARGSGADLLRVAASSWKLFMSCRGCEEVQFAFCGMSERVDPKLYCTTKPPFGTTPLVSSQ